MHNYIKALTFGEDIIIAGDLNCDMLKTAHEAKALNDFCHCLNLTQLIDKPTRVTLRSLTLIDVMMTSNKDLIAGSGVLETYISDHFVVYCSLKVSN